MGRWHCCTRIERTIHHENAATKSQLLAPTFTRSLLGSPKFKIRRGMAKTATRVALRTQKKGRMSAPSGAGIILFAPYIFLYNKRAQET